jgi:hypothetical protein
VAALGALLVEDDVDPGVDAALERAEEFPDDRLGWSSPAAIRLSRPTRRSP